MEEVKEGIKTVMRENSGKGNLWIKGKRKIKRKIERKENKKVKVQYECRQKIKK